MMGTGTFAEPTFAELLANSHHHLVGLVTNPDRPAGKGKHLEMERGIKRLAVAAGVPVFQPESINTPESLAFVRAWQADLFVVAAYGQILSQELLTLPRLGGINVHSSLLPRYRGSAPIVWAIYHGETETGVTIIRMSPRMDAGDILDQVVEPIRPDDTAGTLEARLAMAGAKLANEVVDRLATGPIVGRPQDPSKVTKAPKLKKDDGLIDWSKTSRQVDCQIRAMQPWPMPYTFWHRPNKSPMRLMVTKVSPRGEQASSAPGTVALVTKDVLGIACGEGEILALDQIQPAGKQPMSAAEFLRGHRVAVGDRFGAETTGTIG